jgi:hypothetical protein
MKKKRETKASKKIENWQFFNLGIYALDFQNKA